MPIDFLSNNKQITIDKKNQRAIIPAALIGVFEDHCVILDTCFVLLTFF